MIRATMNEPLLQIDLPGIQKVKSGKVREMFDLGDRLLLVASDRISAFDCIMPNGIPRKGEVLTQISFFWFDRFASSIPNHLLARAEDPLPPALQPFAAQLARRTMIVKKAKPSGDRVCGARISRRFGLAGIQANAETVCGIKLPTGLKESSDCPSRSSPPPPKRKRATMKTSRFEQAVRNCGRRPRRTSS